MMKFANLGLKQLKTMTTWTLLSAALAATMAPVQAATPIRGLVGVGTWATRAEFKDIKVSKGGRTLWASDFSKGLKGWKTTGGQWKVVGGALQQTTEMEMTSNKFHVKALYGSPSWSDYTLTLKARKLGGREGFLILFGSPGNDTKSWWNLGGWGNTKTAIQSPGIALKPIKGHIDAGRWYNIRVEVKGKGVKCFLNNKLVQQGTRV